MNPSQRKKVVVIGGGFAGLSAAAVLAKQGHAVTLLEKNASLGGRARVWEQDGFLFDMGPSWYWMPEIFEQFYNRFGKTTADFYSLKRLDPSYQVYFGKEETIPVPASVEETIQWFEKTEKGSGEKLRSFLKEAKYKYDVAMTDYVHKVNDSVWEFVNLQTVTSAFRLNMFQSLRKNIRTLFRHPNLISLLEFPVLFLGATPDKTPSLYSMMNYADLSLGTWYPMGGMHEIVRAFEKIAREQGVTIHTDAEVRKIEVKDRKATQVHTASKIFDADVVLAGSDYEHTEQQLLETKNRVYDESYWQQRTMAPSSLLFYIGVNRKIPRLLHHNLFFDKDMEQHAREIYDEPRWPTDPLYYVCAPSKTDSSVAPEGKENLFILMPLAPGLSDTPELRETYFKTLMHRLEKFVGEPFQQDIVVNRNYCINDFKNDYHAYKGNAYGLANTLRQTAFMKPKMKSSKVKNLFYAGQLTVPGPGVPPAIISGQTAAREINRLIEKGQL